MCVNVKYRTLKIVCQVDIKLSIGEKKKESANLSFTLGKNNPLVNTRVLYMLGAAV